MNKYQSNFIWQLAASLRSGDSDPQISPLTWVPRGPCLIVLQRYLGADHTSVPAKWHLIVSNGFSRARV